MSNIMGIASRDFRALFHSVKGSAVFFFFLFIIGFFFYSFIFTFMDYQQRAPMMGDTAPSLSQLLGAIFQNIHFILLLVVPALTMSSFSEERKTGSIRLLTSAPISSLQIVLGKYLACVLIMTLAVTFSLVYPGFIFLYGNPELGPVLTSYLGILLLIFFQVAFGVFVSATTSNQFLAFLFTMLGLFVSLVLNWVAPNITGNSSTEGFLKYLATSTHLENLFKGLITTGDISYFLIFTAIFLCLTHFVFDSHRW